MEADYSDPEVEVSVLMSLMTGQQVWVDNNGVNSMHGAAGTFMYSWFSAHLIHAY